MSEDNKKFVAKIQHFYDVMRQRRDVCDESSITAENNIERIILHERSKETTHLLIAYCEVFEDCLYQASGLM